jgi:hypothetical protein
VLRVVLEAVALAVLDDIGPTVGRVDLLELLGDRETEDGQAAVGLPVGAEAAAQRVAGLGEPGAVAGVGQRLKGRLGRGRAGS